MHMTLKTEPHAYGYKATVKSGSLYIVAYGSTRKAAKAKVISGWLKGTPITGM